MNIVNWTREGLAEVTSVKNVIIKIDDDLISTHTTTLPPSSGFNVKKALAFALEDVLLSDIEDLEFFYKKNDKHYDVVVIEKSLLAQIKETIKTQKLNVKGVFPNFMFVPLAKEGMYYFDENDYITYRSSKCSGGSMHKDLFLSLYKDDIAIATEYSTDYMLLNLMQLDISEFVEKHLKPWISVVILLLISLLLYTYSVHISNNALTAELENLQTENITLFKQTFPDVERIVDINLQTANRIESFNKQQTLRGGDLLSALEQAQLPKPLNAITYDGTTLQLNNQ